MVDLWAAKTEQAQDGIVEFFNKALLQGNGINSATAITGMLLYKDGNFMQVLEGEEEAVRRVYARIGHDPRHRGLLTLLAGTQDERQFPDWSMGFEYQEADEAAAAPGFTDYLDASRALAASAQEFGRAGVFHRVFRDRV